MGRFLIKCMLFAILVVSLFVALYFFRPPNTPLDVATLSHKYALLDSLPAPRIIFVGGSNISFGLDSKRISDSLHIPVINTGFRAGLGLRYQLNTVIPRLKKGDVIVIMPELSNFFGYVDGDETSVLSLATICTSFKEVKYLNEKQLIKVICDFGMALKYYYENQDIEKNAYNVNAYNSFGDNEWHWTDTTKFAITFRKPTDGPVDNEAVKWLSSTITDLREQGYKVILLPETIVESAYQIRRELFAKSFDAMDKAGVPFQAGERAHVMPEEFGYDTPNHLNKAGVDSLTTIVIEELQTLGVGGEQ